MLLYLKVSKGEICCLNLTEREIQILNLTAEGQSNPEIAEKLIISSHTVKAHLGNIMRKLEAKDRVNAVAIAIRNGYIS